MLPHGTTVLSVNASGASAWTTTSRVSTIHPDGTRKNYFLKVRTPFNGRSRHTMLIKVDARDSARVVNTAGS